MSSGPEDDNEASNPTTESPYRNSDMNSLEHDFAEISHALDPESRAELIANIRQELNRWREGIDPQFEIDEVARTSHGVDVTIKELLRFGNFGCIDILRYADKHDTFTSADILHDLNNPHQLYNRLAKLEEMQLIVSRKESFSESAQRRHETEQPKRSHRRLLYKITPRGKVAIKMIDERHPSLNSRIPLLQMIKGIFRRK